MRRWLRAAAEAARGPVGIEAVGAETVSVGLGWARGRYRDRGRGSGACRWRSARVASDPGAVDVGRLPERLEASMSIVSPPVNLPAAFPHRAIRPWSLLARCRPRDAHRDA